MKAKLTGKIKATQAMKDGQVNLAITFKGKADAKSIDAKEIEVDANITLKQLIANDMKIGSTFTMYITDEEAPE